MFRTLAQAFHRHIGQPLSKLGAGLVPDESKRKRSWLHLRKALAVWFGGDKSTVWLHCDQPDIYGVEPLEVCGPVVFKGWALSSRGIASVSFFCDGAFLSEATRGIPRADVAALSAHLRQSPRSGFHYVLDPQTLPAGKHQLTIEAKSYDGSTARNSCTMEVIYSADDYTQWRKRTAASPATLAWIKRHADNLLYRPCVSLFMPLLVTTDAAQIQATIISLEAQAYPYWRLCITCDKSAYEKTGDLLMRLANKDPRISLGVAPFAVPGSTPHCRLEQAGGELISLIEPGDLLEPNALFEVVYRLNRHPTIDLVYTDEDAQVGPNLRGYPLSKADWSPDSLKQPAAIGRLWVARRELFTAAPARGLEFDPDGEQGLLDSLCRQARKIDHLGSILYSRSSPLPRSADGSRCSEHNHYSAHGELPVVLSPAPCPMIDLGNIRNILVVTLDHLGDVLLTFPAIERLRRMFPDARITALVGSWAESLARGNACIDDVLTYDFFEASSSRPHKLLDEEETNRIAGWLSANLFDLAVDFRREPQTREFLRWSRARYTVGFANWKESEWLTIGLPYEANLHRVNPRRHVCQELIHLVEMIEVAGREDVCPHVTVTASEVDTVNALLGSSVARDERLLVAIHPGSGREIKCWPAEYFARLADLLMDRLNAQVVLFGTASEVPIVQLIQSCMRRGSETASLAGKLTIGQFLAVLKHFDCFIGNDSGPTHMAASAGLPTLCICSGTIDPAQWAPIGPAALVIRRQMICSPCYLRDREECPFDVACLRELSVEAVWEATLRMLLPVWQKLIDCPEFRVVRQSGNLTPSAIQECHVEQAVS